MLLKLSKGLKHYFSISVLYWPDNADRVAPAGFWNDITLVFDPSDIINHKSVGSVQSVPDKDNLLVSFCSGEARVLANEVIKVIPLDRGQHVQPKVDMEEPRVGFRGQSRDSIQTALCDDDDGILLVGFHGASRGWKDGPAKMIRAEEFKVGAWVSKKIMWESCCRIIDILLMIILEDKDVFKKERLSRIVLAGVFELDIQPNDNVLLIVLVKAIVPWKLGFHGVTMRFLHPHIWFLTIFTHINIYHLQHLHLYVQPPSLIPPPSPSPCLYTPPFTLTCHITLSTRQPFYAIETTTSMTYYIAAIADSPKVKNSLPVTDELPEAASTPRS